MKIDSKTVDKIKKLLALAKSSNENEAALAAQRASELLLRYNLTEEDFRNTVDFSTDMKSEQILITHDHDEVIWKSLMLSGVASLNLCECMHVTPNKGYPGSIWILGREHNRAILKLIGEYLILRVYRLSRQHLKEKLRKIYRFQKQKANQKLNDQQGFTMTIEGKSYGVVFPTFDGYSGLFEALEGKSLEHMTKKDKIKYLNSYRKGMAVRIGQRFEERKEYLRKKGFEEENAVAGALVVVKDMFDREEQLFKDWLNKHNLNIDERTETFDREHPEAFVAGIQDGDKVGLDPQLGGRG